MADAQGQFTAPCHLSGRWPRIIRRSTLTGGQQCDREGQEWSLAVLVCLGVLFATVIVGVVIIFRMTFLPASTGGGSGTIPIPSVQRITTPTVVR